MSPPVARFGAILLLSVQLLPIGLPLVCDQVRDTSAACEQQLPSHQDAALDVERPSPACLNSAFCPTHITAVPEFGVTVLVPLGESELGGLPRAEFVPADPQAPLPPPPEA